MGISTVLGLSLQQNEQLVQEEQEDYFEKWLNEDVVYIISDEERAVFENLSTDEEREQFIEQFWWRRDPDPRTAANEFKEEHYRRLAYVNEVYSVGKPGWMTDRGRVYIIHGPPDQIESHPTGGMYQRPAWEGGGTTQTYPWELWRYHYIEGLGSDIELEFVDQGLSGHYHLALLPEEKDAFLLMGAGPTQAELRGLSSHGDRSYFSPGKPNPITAYQRQRDMPFERYLRFSRAQANAPIKYKDLQEIVKVNLTYDRLPLKARLDFFRLNDTHHLVPITVELQDKDLSFQEQDGVLTSEVAVYGIVTTITNRVVKEFEDDLVVGYSPQEGQVAGLGTSVYQKIIVLETKDRCKLDLVLKDLVSGKVGVVRKALDVPQHSPDEFFLSSVLLSDAIYLLDEMPEDDTMFVLGDVKIRPSLTNVFSLSHPVGLYYQAYNFKLDQSDLTPSLKATYRISRGEDTVVELADESGQGVQFFSSQRAVLLQQLPVNNLEPGHYRLAITLEDRVAERSSTASLEFDLVDPNAQKSANRAGS